MDTRRVRNIWATGLRRGLLVSVLAVTGVLTLDVRDSQPAADATVLDSAADDGAGQDDNGGLGPPPWARARGMGVDRGGTIDGWQDDWRALSPAQKGRKMAALAREHEDGMRSWARCVRAAGTDTDRRRTCEKPLPPGLAKKRS